MYLPNIVGFIFSNPVVRCGEGSRNDIPVSASLVFNGPIVLPTTKSIWENIL